MRSSYKSNLQYLPVQTAGCSTKANKLLLLLLFGFLTHITALWPMEAPVARQNFSLLFIVQDCETGFLLTT